jgi:hypothetical protein
MLDRSVETFQIIKFLAHCLYSCSCLQLQTSIFFILPFDEDCKHSGERFYYILFF